MFRSKVLKVRSPPRYRYHLVSVIPLDIYDFSHPVVLAGFCEFLHIWPGFVPFVGFCWVLQVSAGSCRVLKLFIGFRRVFTGYGRHCKFWRFLPKFASFCNFWLVFVTFAGFCWFLRIFAGFCRVLQLFKVFARISEFL